MATEDRDFLSSDKEEGEEEEKEKANHEASKNQGKENTPGNLGSREKDRRAGQKSSEDDM